MALITISGFPASGKSKRARQIKDHLEQCLSDISYAGPELKVVILSDDVLNIDRNAYNGAFDKISLELDTLSYRI